MSTPLNTGRGQSPQPKKQSFWDLLNPLNPDSPLYLLPGPPLTKKQEKQGPTLGPGPNNLLYTQQQQQSATQAASNPFGLNFSAVTDFLSFMGWIFHPLNWLRLAEFLVGVLLIGTGIYMLAQGGMRRGPTALARRVITMGPAGRTIRTMEGRRMGRHEGQREAARMEARQNETRAQRESSAVERERINLDARRRARES